MRRKTQSKSELVHLAFAMKKFAKMEAEVSGEFKAAQMVAEAIYKQGCYGWQRVDGEVPKHQLVVLAGEEGRVLVNMRTVDLSPLLANAAIWNEAKRQPDS